MAYVALLATTAGPRSDAAQLIAHDSLPLLCKYSSKDSESYKKQIPPNDLYQGRPPRALAVLAVLGGSAATAFASWLTPSPQYDCRLCHSIHTP